jgi:hypothetical protein
MDRSAMAPSPSASPGVIGEAAKAGRDGRKVDDRMWITMDLLDSSLEAIEGVWGAWNPSADDDIVNNARIQLCWRVAFIIRRIN